MNSYTLRNIPDEIWDKVKIIAKRDFRPLRGVVILALGQYVTTEEKTPMKKRERDELKEAEFWAKEMGHLNYMLDPKEKQALRGYALSEKRPVHAIMLEAIQAFLKGKE